MSKSNAAKKLETNVRPLLQMTTKEQEVTPEQAAEWLEKKNVVNRDIRPKKVAAFAYDMVKGKWELTEQGLAFDVDGNLVDGQHRLKAIVEANVPVVMRITRNAPRINAIRDRGTLREVGDFLYKKDGTHAPCSRRITTWMKTIELLNTSAWPRITIERARELYGENEEACDWLLAKQPPLKYRYAMLGAFVYAYPVAPEQVNDFADQFFSGANLMVGSPVLALSKVTTLNAEPSWQVALDNAFRTLTCIKAFSFGRGRKLNEAQRSTHAYQFFRAERERKGMGC